MSSNASRRGAIAAMLVTILIWAYSWVVMKQVLQHAGPFQFSALRYTLGALVLFGVLLATRQPLRPPPLLAPSPWARRPAPWSRRRSTNRAREVVSREVVSREVVSREVVVSDAWTPPRARLRRPASSRL